MEATREFYRRSNPAERVTVGHVDAATVETITADGLHLWSTRSQFEAEYFPVDMFPSEHFAFSDIAPLALDAVETLAMTGGCDIKPIVGYLPQAGRMSKANQEMLIGSSTFLMFEQILMGAAPRLSEKVALVLSMNGVFETDRRYRQGHRWPVSSLKVAR